MTLPTTGPISLIDIQTEFGGVNTISINEYYLGLPNTYVPAGTVGYPGGIRTIIPSSGTISFANFYGATKRIPQLYTFTAGTNFVPPIGMTTAQIILVGGGGQGGSAINSTFNTEFVSGGGGGGGQVVFLDNFAIPQDNGVPSFPQQPIMISIGFGGTSAGQAGTTSVSIPSFGTINAVGGFSGSNGVNKQPGIGGSSGSGFAGGVPSPGVVTVGGGGGGDTGPGVSAGQGGPGRTITIGGSTFNFSTGGNSGDENPGGNPGAGGGGGIRSLVGTTTGQSGFNGIVYIYG